MGLKFSTRDLWVHQWLLNWWQQLSSSKNLSWSWGSQVGRVLLSVFPFCGWLLTGPFLCRFRVGECSCIEFRVRMAVLCSGDDILWPFTSFSGCYILPASLPWCSLSLGGMAYMPCLWLNPQLFLVLLYFQVGGHLMVQPHLTYFI